MEGEWTKSEMANYDRGVYHGESSPVLVDSAVVTAFEPMLCLVVGAFGGTALGWSMGVGWLSMV